MMKSRGRWPGLAHGLLLWSVLFALAGCSRPMPVSAFGSTAPAFDPVRFFTGHTHSWGVLENRGGGPTEIVTTDDRGTPEGENGLHLIQTITLGDGTVQHRDWHMRRVAPGRYQATANDMVGTATGQSAGRVFHWCWVLATDPGNALKNVTMEQWMYFMDGGTMVNRTAISKLGVILAEVTEQFAPAP